MSTLQEQAKVNTKKALERTTSKDGNIYRELVDDLEAGMLEVAMEQLRGNQSAIARKLGVNRATLRTKMKRHGLL